MVGGLLEHSSTVAAEAMPRAVYRAHDFAAQAEPTRTAAAAERGRRIINVVVALSGLTLCMPLLALIAALVKLTSRGPVLYKQQRVGMNRRAPGVPAGNCRRSL